MREQRKRLTGVVTSDKMDKTIVVEVTIKKRHPLYEKVVRQMVIARECSACVQPPFWVVRALDHRFGGSTHTQRRQVVGRTQKRRGATRSRSNRE